MLSQYASNAAWQRLLFQDAEANPTRLCHFETLVSAGICQNETLSAEEICHFDTLADGLNYYFETLVEAGICQFDTIINILNRLRYAPLLRQDTIPTKISAKTVGRGLQKEDAVLVDGNGRWDYSKLMRGINPELRKKIQKQNLEQRFLAWLIAGSLNTEIHSPISFAIAATLENQQTPDIHALRLADLQPDTLKTLLNKTMRRLEKNYLGPIINVGAGSEELTALLQSVSDNLGRIKLLRRLADALSIEV